MQAVPGAAASIATTRREGNDTRDLILALGALGVVYGDLGTNPLFALRECFASSHPLALAPANVLGAVSLALWALILVICIKYTVFILRADNEGEGGTLALLGKIPPRMRDGVASRPVVLVMVLLFGSALLLGDGIVTPAISVLSAVEGLGVEQGRIVLYTVIILIALFAAQRFGTARVGAVFGPVMLVWFATIAVLGVVQIVQQPAILRAIDPRYAIAVLRSGQPGSYLVLNAIILVVAGGEALYADLGHFGRRPIVRAWYWIVLPALALVYAGQGALLIRDPHAIENPFFAMAPAALRVPLVVLATAATVIASQALISGAFSLARQGINLGFLPRMKVEHTSNEETGQIYVPAVNTLLAIGCLALVIGFGSSAKLAGAYGLAVNGTMTATTFGFFFVMWKVWRRPLVLCIALAACFFTIDLAFLGANVTKILEGGWVPLSAGAGLFGVAMIWRWGRRAISRSVGGRAIPIDELFARDDLGAVPRVPGTAVFLTSATGGAPPILVHHVERNGALHEQVVLLSLQVLDVPFVEPRRRLAETELGRGFFRVVARYGYAESPNVPALLEACAILGLAVDFDRITYVVGRDALRLRYDHGLFSIPRRVFAFLSRNQAPAVGYFGMPVERVIEIGMQIQL
ncbi:MAG TPA: KUP/HAK/KT family potassium transporter [Kofleriaceae bacterium]|nr:KUP/HAK/KT family potassium transporter [Kofleriaceae bacterium]